MARMERTRCWWVPILPVTPFMMIPILCIAVSSPIPSLDLHYLIITAKLANEALRVVAAVHFSLVGQTRNGDGRSGSQVSAVVAPSPVNDLVGVGLLVLPDEHRALDGHRHWSLLFCATCIHTLPTGRQPKQKAEAPATLGPGSLVCLRVTLPTEPLDRVEK